MDHDDVERIIKALERIADALEVRMPPRRVTTNLPEGSFEIGYITAGGQEMPDQVEVYGLDGKHRFTYRKSVALKT